MISPSSADYKSVSGGGGLCEAALKPALLLGAWLVVMVSAGGLSLAGSVWLRSDEAFLAGRNTV